MTALRGLFGLVLLAGLVLVAGLGLAHNLRAAMITAAEEQDWLQGEIARLEQRLAELAALPVADGPRYPAIQANDQIGAELALQSRLLDLASAAGVSLTSFGVSGLPVETDLPALGYALEFEAGHDAAMALIQEIEHDQPALSVYALWLRQLPTGALGDVATPVSVQMTIWTYWTNDGADQRAGEGN